MLLFLKFHTFLYNNDLQIHIYIYIIHVFTIVYIINYTLIWKEFNHRVKAQQASCSNTNVDEDFRKGSYDFGTKIR